MSTPIPPAGKESTDTHSMDFSGIGAGIVTGDVSMTSVGSSFTSSASVLPSLPSSSSKSMSAGSESPMIFSLQHPLQEITPIATLSGVRALSADRIHYFTDQEDVVVASISECTPQLIVTYNRGQNAHSIWQIIDAPSPVAVVPAIGQQHGRKIKRRRSRSASITSQRINASSASFSVPADNQAWPEQSGTITPNYSVCKLN